MGAWRQAPKIGLTNPRARGGSRGRACRCAGLLQAPVCKRKSAAAKGRRELVSETWVTSELSGHFLLIF